MMKNTVLYLKQITNEEKQAFQLEYSLLVSEEEHQEIYGISIRKTDDSGHAETEAVKGLFEERKEAECFLEGLAKGEAFPMELVVLCDEYITERENGDERSLMQSVS